MEQDPPSSPEVSASPSKDVVASQVGPVRVKAKSHNSKTQIACLSCRTVKVRCSNAESGDTSSTCARCIRLNITCEYKPHRRGRKPVNWHANRSNSTEDSPTSPHRPEFGTTMALSPVSSHSNEASTSSQGPHPFRFKMGNSERPPPEHNSVHPRDFSVAAPIESPGTFNSPKQQQRRPGSSSRMGITNMLNPVRSVRDPLDRGLLSEADVISLFSCFFTQLNPFIGILDPLLHTHSNVRHRSTLLFTAILAAAAKIIWADIYQKLIDDANDLLLGAMQDDVCTIELIQSISILAFFKEPEDGTAWRKVGYAIRLAFELDLHIPRSRPLPSDETQAREILNAERTWIQIICYDRSLAAQHQKPRMITDDLVPDVIAWASEHKMRYPCTVDATLVSLVELGFQVMARETLRKVKCRDYFHQTALLDEFHRQQMAWKHRWLNGAPPLELSKKQRAILKFKNASGELLFAEATYDAMVAESSIPSKIASHLLVDGLGVLVTKALDVLRVVSDTFVPCEWLRLVQDTVMFDTARAGLSLATRYSLVSADGQSSIRTAFEAIIDGGSKAATHEKEAPAYLARFFQQLLRRVSIQPPEFQLVSPAPSSSVATPSPAIPTSGTRQLFFSDYVTHPSAEHDTPGPDESWRPTLGDNTYWHCVWPEMERFLSTIPESVS